MIRNWEFGSMAQLRRSLHEVCSDVIGEWNDNLIQRMQYSMLAIQYFTACKNKTMTIIDFPHELCRKITKKTPVF